MAVSQMMYYNNSLIGHEDVNWSREQFPGLLLVQSKFSRPASKLLDISSCAGHKTSFHASTAWSDIGNSTGFTATR